MLTWKEGEKKILEEQLSYSCVLSYVMHLRTLAFNIPYLPTQNVSSPQPLCWLIKVACIQP